MTPSVNASMIPNADEMETASQVEGYASLFRNRNFMALWMGQVFSQLADRIIFVVFITLIVMHFGTQGSLKSYLYVAFTIPAILLTSIAGVFADRWPRTPTLVVTNLLRAAIVATIPLAIKAKSLFWLYACAFGISSATQFFVPAESATIPLITRSSQLLVANSLFTTTMMGSIVFGFALGDPMIALFGIKEVHWGIVGLFVLSSLSLAFVHAPKPQLLDAHGRVQETLRDFWAELREGVNYMRAHPVILNRIFKLAILFSYVVSMCIVFVNFAGSYLYADPAIAAQKFSWLITFSGLGMVSGSIVVGRYLREVARGKLVYAGFLLVAVGLLALTATPLLSKRIIYPMTFPYLDWRVLYAHCVTVFLGIGASMVAIPLQSVLHELIPAESRGKILGVQFTLLSASSTLPALIVGLCLDVFEVWVMLVALGAPLLIFAVYGLYHRLTNRNGDYAAHW